MAVLFLYRDGFSQEKSVVISIDMNDISSS